MLSENDSYYSHEKKWLLDDSGCVPRYLRASKWKVEEAKKRIKGTLEWVCDFFAFVWLVGLSVTYCSAGSTSLILFHRRR